MRWVTKLNDLIIAYDREAALGKRKRIWSQLSTGLKEKKFEKYTRALERGKSMLSQAHALEIGATILEDNKHTHKTLEEIVKEFSTLGLRNTQHASIAT